MDNVNVLKCKDRLICAESRYLEYKGKHSIGANYERMYRASERAALKEVYNAQRMLFRAENGLSRSAKINPILFERRFPGSEALIPMCPAEKYKSVRFSPEKFRHRTWVAFAPRHFGNQWYTFFHHRAFDWLHNNATGGWSVSFTDAFATPEASHCTIVSFDSAEDAFLFTVREGGTVISTDQRQPDGTPVTLGEDHAGACHPQ